MKHIKCPGSELKLVVAIRKLIKGQAHLLFYIGLILKSDILNTKNLYYCKENLLSKLYWQWKKSFNKCAWWLKCAVNAT